MQPADKEIINQLNAALKNKLTAINQYFLHARMMKHMGFMKLADYEYKESIQQMKSADRLIERVLFLGGIPNLNELAKLHIGENVADVLKCDLKLAQHNLDEIKQSISLCLSKNDHVSAELLQKILENKEERIAFIRTQINLIDTIGLDKYLQTQV